MSIMISDSTITFVGASLDQQGKGVADDGSKLHPLIKSTPEGACNRRE